MAAAGTAGELGGRIAGGVLGGAIGSVLGPLGTMAGRWVGSRLGGMAGRAAAEALSSMMEEADEGAAEGDEAAAGETDDACDGACRKPECEQLAQDIDNRLNANKHAPGSNSNNHGLNLRRMEQICGAHAPGSDGWNTHTGNITSDQQNLQRLVDQ